MKIGEAVKKPLGRLRRERHDSFDVVAGRAKWVHAFHGTARSDIESLRPREGVVWATMTPAHASSFAMSLRAEFAVARGKEHPTVMLLRVNIAGFLIIDGGGQDIRDLDAMDWQGWSPYETARIYDLPGILFRRVRDTIEDYAFDRIANVLAIADPTRIRWMFGGGENAAGLPRRH